MNRIVLVLLLGIAALASSGCCCQQTRGLPVGLDQLACRLHCLPGSLHKPPFSYQSCPYYDYRCCRWRNFCTSCNCAPTAVATHDVVHDPNCLRSTRRNEFLVASSPPGCGFFVGQQLSHVLHASHCDGHTRYRNGVVAIFVRNDRWRVIVRSVFVDRCNNNL